MARREQEVARTAQGEPISLSEIGKDNAGIEVVEKFDLKDVELEAFMNQTLVIVVMRDNSEGALIGVSPTVNGVTQPILRGVKSHVKRKYVERLARMTKTRYAQVQRDPNDRASLAMVPSSRQSCEFVVVHDPDPRGAAWLEHILAEQM